MIYDSQTPDPNHRLLDDRDLLVAQAIEFVDKLIDPPIR